VAQAPRGLSGCVPCPRRPVPPVAVRSEQLPAPWARCDRLRGWTSPHRRLRRLCPAGPGHPTRGQPPPEVERQDHRRSHVHERCRQRTNVGGGHVPLMPQHPRVQGAFLGPEGLPLADTRRSPGDRPRGLAPDGVSGACALVAVERPPRRLPWLTLVVLSREPDPGGATTPVEPVVSPGEPSPGGRSASRGGG
jgi:hypothetical protein